MAEVDTSAGGEALLLVGAKAPAEEAARVAVKSDRKNFMSMKKRREQKRLQSEGVPKNNNGRQRDRSGSCRQYELLGKILM